jgi:hypothetical protein
LKYETFESIISSQELKPLFCDINIHGIFSEEPFSVISQELKAVNVKKKVPFVFLKQ